MHNAAVSMVEHQLAAALEFFPFFACAGIEDWEAL
jgi:hypothetical protein